MRQGTGEEPECAIIYLSAEAKIENDVDQWITSGRMFADSNVWLSFVMCHGSHPNWITPEIALCPNLHLRMTFFRQLPSSGQAGMPFQWSMSFS